MEDRPRELNIWEIETLDKLGYDPQYFLFLGMDAESKTFLEVQTGKQLILHR